MTDVRIPRLDGVALFHKTRDVAPATAVILMTSFATATEAVAAPEAGST